MELLINGRRAGFRGENDGMVVVAIVRHLWGNEEEGEDEENKEEQDDRRRRSSNKRRRHRAIVITIASEDRDSERMKKPAMFFVRIFAPLYISDYTLSPCSYKNSAQKIHLSY